MTKRSPYAAHRRFVAPALGTPGPRPVILGFIIVESLYRMGQQVLGYALEMADPAFAASVIEGSTPPGLLVNLASFLLLVISLALVLRWVHGRKLSSLFGSFRQLWPQFRATFLAIALLFLGFEALLTGLAPEPGAILRPMPEWLALLLPGILALAIQTGSEELFYRGYLQQQVAAIMPHPAAWLILPNIAFALAHFSAWAPVGENVTYLVWTFFFGLAASDLTARAGTLGPAFALHLANNAYAFLFFGVEDGPDSGLALVLYPTPDAAQPVFETSPVLGLVPELGLLALTWVAARLALRR